MSEKFNKEVFSKKQKEIFWKKFIAFGILVLLGIFMSFFIFQNFQKKLEKIKKEGFLKKTKFLEFKKENFFQKIKQQIKNFENSTNSNFNLSY